MFFPLTNKTWLEPGPCLFKVNSRTVDALRVVQPHLKAKVFIAVLKGQTGNHGEQSAVAEHSGAGHDEPYSGDNSTHLQPVSD